jgi:pimeloyl-ACP methyl ester carboxylesterase
VGRSPAPTEAFTQVADLIAALDQLKIADAVLVGHSGGGATALSLALAEPHRVRSLVLAAPGVSGYPWPDGDPFFAEFDALFSMDDRHGLVALGLKTWAAAGADPQIQHQIRVAVDGMFAQADYLRPDPPAFDQLDRITTPTEILVGGQDHPMILDCADAIAARLPNSLLTQLPAADHMLPLRDPAQLAERIAAALD